MKITQPSTDGARLTTSLGLKDKRFCRNSDPQMHLKIVYCKHSKTEEVERICAGKRTQRTKPILYEPISLDRGKQPQVRVTDPTISGYPQISNNRPNQGKSGMNALRRTTFNIFPQARL